MTAAPVSGTSRRTGTTNGDRVRAFAVLTLAVAQVVSAILAPVLLDADVGAVSDDYTHVLTPAGYAFAVWGLIYAASLALAGYQALPSQQSRAVHRRSGWSIAAGFAASTIWVPLFVLERLLAAQVVLVALVVALAVAAARLSADPDPGDSGRGADRWLLRLPVAGYLGWATIATVAGAGTTGRWLGVTVGPHDAVAAAALVTAGLVAVLVSLAIRAAAGFAATVAWGLAGIAVATSSALVAGVAIAVAVALAVAVGLRAAHSRDPVRDLLG